MIRIISLFRSSRVALRKEGRPLRVYFLFELFHCSQTQLSDVTIPFASYQKNYTVVKETSLASLSSGMPSSFALLIDSLKDPKINENS